ncbi:MAG: zinc ribbon domain-containing protein [Thermotoga sp.]|nr:MAG: zinc ribbon domain-containing protein [Thermotoga sp.]
MPIYTYKCDNCGEEFSVLQHIYDAPLKTCPICGGRLRKLIGNVAVVYKSSGFYTTDSKAKPRGETSSKTQKKRKDRRSA